MTESAPPIDSENQARSGPLEMPGAKKSIGFMLSRVGASVADEFSKTVAKHGLAPRQFFVLNLVSEYEGQSQQAISASLSVTKSRMVSVVDELEEKGLVERRPNPVDRRQHALFLTNAGRKLLDQGRASAQELEEKLSAVLAPGERERLLKTLQKLATLDDVPDGMHPAIVRKLDIETG